MGVSEFAKESDGALQLWTDKQVAAFLNVSLATVRRWRLTGFGPPFYRIGASIRYSSAGCERWLDSQSSGGERAKQ